MAGKHKRNFKSLWTKKQKHNKTENQTENNLSPTLSSNATDTNLNNNIQVASGSFLENSSTLASLKTVPKQDDIATEPVPGTSGISKTEAKNNDSVSESVDDLDKIETQSEKSHDTINGKKDDTEKVEIVSLDDEEDGNCAMECVAVGVQMCECIIL